MLFKFTEKAYTNIFRLEFIKKYYFRPKSANLEDIENVPAVRDCNLELLGTVRITSGKQQFAAFNLKKQEEPILPIEFRRAIKRSHEQYEIEDTSCIISTPKLIVSKYRNFSLKNIVFIRL